MIILLNNKSFTEQDLIERLYSEDWKIEQREYGIGNLVKVLIPTSKSKVKNPIVRYARSQKARRIKANRKLGIDLKTNIPQNSELNRNLAKEITKSGENWVLDNNGWYKFQNNVAKESAIPVNRVTLGINNSKYAKISPESCINLSESKALLAAKTKKNIINLEGNLLDSTVPMDIF